MKKSLSIFVIFLISNYISCSNTFSPLSTVNISTKDFAADTKIKTKKIEIPEVPTLSQMENSDELDELDDQLDDLVDEENKEVNPQLSMNETINNSKKQIYRRKGKEDSLSKIKSHRLVPESALKDSPSLHYAYGEYTMPSKIWYYHKKKSGSAGTYSSSEFYNYKIILPTQMKELDVSTQFIIYMRNHPHSNGNWPSFLVELIIDDEVIARQSGSASLNNSGFYQTYQITLSGKIFNLAAGNHKVKCRYSTITGNYIASYGSISGHGSYAYTEIAIVGYPSS